ncbi:hypothetical protein HNQ36_002696 [Afipia massiliensis]|uniref:Uncharacterized protein n=1 Tax=Afipia massiliensis TaxID=211460 RepID=A0A840N1A0_9BRAD|nr:hypothetical protein [Afipia massiliensis]
MIEQVKNIRKGFKSIIRNIPTAQVPRVYLQVTC